MSILVALEALNASVFIRIIVAGLSIEVKILKSAIATATVTLMSRNACNGENGETGEKSPAAGDLNWMPKVAPWRLAILEKMAILAKLAILAKIARGLAICGKIFKLDAKRGPFKVDN